jgi:hypothetical protein
MNPTFTPDVHPSPATAHRRTPVRASVPLMACSALAAAMLAPPAALPAAAVDLSAVGSATIDGQRGAQWNPAAKRAFTVDLPSGGTAPATLLAMNDATYLYVGIAVKLPAAPRSSVAIELDTEANGQCEGFEDSLFLSTDAGTAPRDGAINCSPGSISLGHRADTLQGGGNHILGDWGYSAGEFFVEFRHPLASGDAGLDIDVGRGDRFGIQPDVTLCDVHACGYTRAFTDASTDYVVAAASPAPPWSDWITDSSFPDFRFQVRITASGPPRPGEPDGTCLAETLCVSGAVAGRTEALVRIIGPRPDGWYWVQVLRFTSARVEVWVQQSSTGIVRYYPLPSISADSNVLPGLVDRKAFQP